MAIRYKSVCLTHAGIAPHFMLYAGFEYRDGFKWVASPIVVSKSQDRIDAFAERNGITVEDDGTHDTTRGAYCPNRGIIPF